MKKITTILAIVLLAVAAPVYQTGCTSPASLDTVGVYHGDNVLYQADLALTSSYAVLDAFVKWELANRPLLVNQPGVTRAADNIRRHAPGWFSSAHALREAYASAPTASSKANLQKILAVISAALVEAGSYIATPLPDSAK